MNEGAPAVFVAAFEGGLRLTHPSTFSSDTARAVSREDRCFPCKAPLLVLSSGDSVFRRRLMPRPRSNRIEADPPERCPERRPTWKLVQKRGRLFWFTGGSWTAPAGRVFTTS